jgi:hypothetical protein
VTYFPPLLFAAAIISACADLTLPAIAFRTDNFPLTSARTHY